MAAVLCHWVLGVLWSQQLTITTKGRSLFQTCNCMLTKWKTHLNKKYSKVLDTVPGTELNGEFIFPFTEPHALCCSLCISTCDTPDLLSSDDVQGVRFDFQLVKCIWGALESEIPGLCKYLLYRLQAVCMVKGKLLHFSMPQFPHLENTQKSISLPFWHGFMGMSGMELEMEIRRLSFLWVWCSNCNSSSPNTWYFKPHCT